MLSLRGFDKDGRHVLLSLVIAACFLVWSLNWGFLAQYGLLLQMIWSLIYVYSMVHYRYTLSSFINRLILVGVVGFFKSFYRTRVCVRKFDCMGARRGAFACFTFTAASFSYAVRLSPKQFCFLFAAKGLLGVVDFGLPRVFN
jgi:hypothetical protein